MRKNIIYSLLLALTAFGFVSCNSDSDPVTSPDEVLTPIRISAAYEGSHTTRVAYAEDGDNISATWQAGDQLYVCYNGHVNTLTLSDGAGTATATFAGTIQGTPTNNSVLICYVRDANNPSAVSVNNNGEYTYASNTFTSQDGTLAGAAKCNLYYGTTTYGTGEDISCTFSVNTSMLKFTVYAPDGVSAGDNATLTYKSDGTALAAASFTVGANGKNTIYMTVPAGQYTGEQTLQYVSGLADVSKTLSATKATFTAGQTYSKVINFGSSVHTLAEATPDDIGKIAGADGNIYDTKEHAEASGTTAVAMIAYVGSDAETNSTYRHGLALALKDVSVKKKWCLQYQATCLDTQYGSESAAKGDMAGLANTDALVSHTSHTHDAATAARNYQYADGVTAGAHPDGTSAWFLPSAGQWDKMATAAGGYANLKTNAGLHSSVHYWLSSEFNAGYAWYFDNDQGKVYYCYKDDYSFFVRACLAF